MMFNTRWLLPMAMVGSLVVACSSNGGGGGGTTTPDASTTPDATTADASTDAPRSDASTDVRTDARTDAATDRPTSTPCGSPTDISSMMPGSDGAIRIMGDNSSGAATSLGSLPMTCVNGGRGGAKGSVLVYSYVMRTAGALRVSTANDGTAEDFDSIVAVLSSCSATAPSLACNDDVGSGNLASTAQTGALMAGQRVFIVVGGFGEDAETASTGAFELTVQEVAPVAVGGACTGTTICATGSTCVANVGSTTMGTCLADGAARGLCRTSGTACDTGFVCSVEMPSATVRGQCLPPAALGAPCGAVGICTMGNVCPNIAIAATTTTDAGTADASVDASVDAGASDAATDGSTATDAGATDAGATDASATDGGTPGSDRRCVAPVAETEPNNTPMAATPTVTASTVFRASLTAGDVDCFAVTVPAGTTITAETHDANGTCNLGTGADTIVRVYGQADGGSSMIAENDDISASNLCSRVSGATSPALTRVAAGTYQVCVSAFAAPDASAMPVMNYYLSIGLN